MILKWLLSLRILSQTRHKFFISEEVSGPSPTKCFLPTSFAIRRNEFLRLNFSAGDVMFGRSKPVNALTSTYIPVRDPISRIITSMSCVAVESLGNPNASLRISSPRVCPVVSKDYRAQIPPFTPTPKNATRSSTFPYFSASI